MKFLLQSQLPSCCKKCTNSNYPVLPDSFTKSWRDRCAPTARRAGILNMFHVEQ